MCILNKGSTTYVSYHTVFSHSNNHVTLHSPIHGQKQLSFHIMKYTQSSLIRHNAWVLTERQPATSLRQVIPQLLTESDHSIFMGPNVNHYHTAHLLTITCAYMFVPSASYLLCPMLSLFFHSSTHWSIIDGSSPSIFLCHPQCQSGFVYSTQLC